MHKSIDNVDVSSKLLISLCFRLVKVFIYFLFIFILVVDALQFYWIENRVGSLQTFCTASQVSDSDL